MTTPNTQGAAPPPPKKGILGKLQGLLSIFKRKPKGKEMDLGKKNQFVFDKKLGRWVIPGQKVEEEEDVPPPPSATGVVSAAVIPAGSIPKKEKGSKKKKPRYAVGPGAEPEEEPVAPLVDPGIANFEPGKIESGPPDTRGEGEKAVVEQANKEETKSIEPEESASNVGGAANNSVIVKKSDIREDRSEEIAFLVARNKDLEQQLEESEQKANEAEFLLKEYIEEIESENTQFEEETKSLFNEKAFMSVALQAKEKEIAEYQEKLAAVEKIVEELKKERENYLQLLLKDDSTADPSTTKENEPTPPSSEDEEEKATSPQNSKKLMEAEEELFQMRCKLQEYEGTSEEREESLKRVQEEFENATVEIESLKTALEEAKKDHEKTLTEETAKKDAEIEALKSEINHVQELLKKTHEELDGKAEAVREAENGARMICEELGQWKAEAEAKDKKMHEMEETCEKMKEDHLAEVDRLQKEISESAATLAQSRQEAASLAKKLSETETSLDDSRKTILENQQKLGAATAQIDKLTQDLAVSQRNHFQEMDAEKVLFQKTISEESQKHKDELAKSQGTIFDLETRIKKLETQIIDIKKQPISEEALNKLQEQHEQQIAELYQSFDTEAEARYSQFTQEYEELEKAHYKTQAELAQEKLNNDYHLKVISFINTKLVGILNQFGISSGENLAEKLESLEKYITTQDRELEQQKLVATLAENKTYLVEACIEEIKADKQKTVMLLEERSNEAAYYQDLSKIYHESILKLKDQIRTQSQSNKALEDTISALRKESSATAQKLADAGQENATLRTQLEHHKKLLSETKAELTSLQKAAELAKQKSEKEKAAIREEAEQKVAALEKGSETLRQEGKKLEKEKVAAEKMGEKLHAEIHEMEQTVGELNKTVAGLEKANVEYEGKLKEEGEKIKALEDQIAKKDHEKLRCEKETENAQAELEAEKAQTKQKELEHVKQLDELQKEIENLKVENEALTASSKTIETLKGQLAEYQARISSVESQKTIHDSVLSERDHLKVETESLQTRVKELEAKNQELTQDIKDKEAGRLSLRKNLEELVEREKTLAQQVEHLKSIQSEIGRSAEQKEGEIEGLRKALEEQKAIVAGLGSRKEGLEKQVESYKTQLAAQGKGETQLVASLKAELLSTQAELAKTKKSLETEKAELDKTRKVLETEKAQLQEELAKTKKSLETENAELVKAKKSLETELAKVNKLLETEKAQLQAELAKAKKSLETEKAELVKTNKLLETEKTRLEAELDKVNKFLEVEKAELEKASKSPDSELAKISQEKTELETKLQNAMLILNEYNQEPKIILQKLQAHGEEFKPYYADFKDKPIRFASFVVDKMSAHIQTLIAELRKLHVTSEPTSPQTAPAGMVAKPAEEKKEESKKTEGAGQKKAGITGWLGSFFLTEKEIENLKGPKQI